MKKQLQIVTDLFDNRFTDKELTDVVLMTNHRITVGGKYSHELYEKILRMFPNSHQNDINNRNIRRLYRITTEWQGELIDFQLTF
jgi:hypothetical protein